jgi:pachytene checkpoint protein 2
VSPVNQSTRRPTPDQKGILDVWPLRDAEFDGIWESLILPSGLKDRLLAQAVLNFTARPKLQKAFLPMHGIILLVGPPGTGKTSLARGLASRTAAALGCHMTFIEVDPHSLASATLGKSQQAVTHLLGSVIADAGQRRPVHRAARRSRNPGGRSPQDEHGSQSG